MQQLKVTKDEAAIIADLLLEHKYDYSDNQYSREDAKRVIAALDDLQHRMFNHSKDKRLNSRKKSWSFQDRLMKLVDNYELKKQSK